MTLVEMIMVIVITGIVAAVVAVFISRPIEGYVDAARRAELTDIADTALRRITRDVRTALPNSIRVTTAPGGVIYLEYLQTSGGGRYRTDLKDDGTGDPLTFTAADTTFDVLGPMPAFSGGESIVIYNLAADPLVTVANAYVGDNRAAGSGAGSTITLSPAPAAPFPFPSPGRRFQVVQYPVTYECAPDSVTPANGVLRRYWNYTIDAVQPAPPAVAPAPGGGSSALLASNVSACSFTYSDTTGGASGRTGVVALTLEIQQSGETVRLFQQAHVSNVP